MRKIIALYLLLFTTTSTIAQQLSQPDYLTDLQFFKTTLPQRHVNLFTKISQDDFEQRVSTIEKNVGSLNNETFVAAISGVLVAIGDEHTFVEQKFTSFFPIKFELFEEGFFVTGIAQSESNLLLNQLKAINGISIEEVTNRFKTIVASENLSYFQSGMLSSLHNPSILKGLKLIDDLNSITYTLTDSTGKDTDVTLNPVDKQLVENITLSKAYAHLSSAKSKDFYWYQFDEKNKVLYVNYNRCSEMDDKPFSQFNNELFAFIEAKRPVKLILDLRYNSGGNSAILEPFQEKMSHSYLNNKKSLYVLIGRKTFSSALMNAVEMKRNLSITLVGETTSGNINHFGEVRGFKLPKSGLTIGYSTKYWETWKGKKGGLQPDVKISYAIKNFKNGKDEAISYVNSK